VHNMADIYALRDVRATELTGSSDADRDSEIEGDFDMRSFVEKYQGVVVNTCDHFVRDMDDAYDIAQHVFMAALSVSSRITTDGEWRAWLYRTAVNRSLDVLRSRRRHRWLRSLTGRHSDGIDANNIAAKDGKRPDRELEIAELRRELDNAIDKLPERQRAAFILHRHEGLTNSEIAAVMQLRTKAVDALLHRALTSLRKQLLTHYR
jgi:RNA polymerase sigma-70 factor (ECF subfamily)